MTTSAPQLSIKTFLNPFELYSDSRGHGYQGSSRNVRLGRVTPPGGGSIAKSEDGTRCVVTGKESLRILRVSEPSEGNNPDHKFSVGRGGHRIDASRNFWDTSGLKIDSASTDVAWGHGQFNNKILTSARNGELILWDLNKSGVTKYERRTKDHIRSIHQMSVSHVVHHYCITGSADGHMRVWDIRDLSKSIMRVHHPTSVRSLVFSPSLWQPLQAIAGLDNGSIYRWDLRMGQRGLLDKLPVAHTASVTALDWCSAGGVGSQGTSAVGITGQGDPGSTGLGWLVSGGLDRCVKVWDLTSPGASTHIPHKPTYTLHPSFAVRRLAWRPGYECEIAVVSTTEYAATSVDSSNSASSGLLTQTGSGHGLDHIVRGTHPESIYPSKDKMSVQADVKASSSIPSIPSMGDAIEIWDARRGWLAKWSVRGSAVEGGVTDITFGDSHAIWAQHTSGSFSQIDLRDATKPIDAIPRVAATWEATGSMAFVIDKADRWEVPYDDIRPERKNAVDLPKPSTKTLGDPTFKQSTQTVGTFSELTDTNLETFTTLARRYIYEGRDRKDICAYNAGVAFGAGHESAAQIWLLLGASLAEYIPTHPPTPPPSPPTMSADLPIPATQLSPSVSTTMTGYSFPASFTSKTAESSPPIPQRISPGRRSTSGSLSRVSSHTTSSSTSRRLTPTSSTSSSPRHIPLSLPPVTPRRASFFGRRESVDSGSVPHPSTLRRPSIPPSFGISASSPGDRSTPSLRHVGEGALDDSDSSGSEEGLEGEETAAANSSDGERANVTRPEQSQTAPRNIPTPSPLSRIAGHQAWTEDEDGGGTDHEDDAYSPSPQSSTDSDSHGSSSPDRRSKSVRAFRRSSSHFKSRSRSSTVASLAAPQPRPVSRQNSKSSIRTVTGPDAPGRDQVEGQSVHGHEPPVIPSQDPRIGHLRHKSLTVSEKIANSTKPNTPAVRVVDIPADTSDDGQMTERRIEIIKLDDNRFKTTTLKALELALEQFAEDGDVQMCSMLALVAPEELHISRSRVRRFLDSYIEILTRLRLHTCSAYIRKYCDNEDIRKPTLMGTTIYTSCGKCRKALLVPAGSFSGRVINQGAFSYCLGCKSSVVMCSICRLPVRALLFQCSVCHHGGHQACYRQYYLQQPMVDLPTSFIPANDSSRGRASVRISSTSVEDDAGSTADTSGIPSPEQTHHPKTLAGHPCAAGCGHFCWAANKEWEELP